MGKKGRKTRWRRLPIDGPESSTVATSSNSSTQAEERENSVSRSSPEHRVTFNEDEYTKITTPRQDVLFKKGYLGRRRTNNNPTSDAQEVQSVDSMESESYIAEEPAQFAYMPPPTGFIDHNSGVFYVNSGTYELYDPYSGNVTVVVGPAPQYPPQPVLAAMPCQPVPLNPLEWFNPPAPWVCPYDNRRKRYSTDSQNCSAQSSESTGPPGSPQEPLDDGAGVMFPPQPPPPYIYPGYMFGAPVYNMNGVNVQGVIPQQQVPPPPTTEIINNPNAPINNITTTKRRKKRRRKRRGGVTDEGSESSCEEVIGCDTAACSQSGASSDAGQGSSCSKTNSDSGINTEPTPDSGSNTPPLMPQLTTTAAQNLCASMVENDNQEDEVINDQFNSQDLNQEQLQISELEIEVEVDPVSSSLSTPDIHKNTFESLPSEDGETLQELSCSSELNVDVKVDSKCEDENSIQNDNENGKFDSNLGMDDTRNSSTINDIQTQVCVEGDIISYSENIEEEDVIKNLNLNEGENLSSDLFVSGEKIDSEPVSDFTEINDDLVYDEIPVMNETDEYVDDKTFSSFKSLSTDSSSNGIDENIESNIELSKEILEDNKEIDCTAKKINDVCSCNGEDKLPIVTIIPDKENKTLIKNSNYELSSDNTSFQPIIVTLTDESVQNKDILSSDLKNSHKEMNYLSLHRDEEAPVPPPRRKRSLFRAAEKVAKELVDEVIEQAMKEAACRKCQLRGLPITEAVTRWLHSQGSVILPLPDFNEGLEERYEEDEGIEDGEGSLTNQKNVEGNPFLVPYHSGSRQRVADSDDCGSLVSSAGEWDMYDHNTHTRAICDPATSVDKYYRLGVEDLEEKVTSSSMIKTAVHIRRAGPFPCGVCCIIQ